MNTLVTPSPRSTAAALVVLARKAAKETERA
jgi:hypothetical protein